MKYSYEYKKQCVELYRQGKWPETPEGVSKYRPVATNAHNQTVLVGVYAYPKPCNVVSQLVGKGYRDSRYQNLQHGTLMCHIRHLLRKGVHSIDPLSDSGKGRYLRNTLLNLKRKILNLQKSKVIFPESAPSRSIYTPVTFSITIYLKSYYNNYLYNYKSSFVKHHTI